MSLEQLTQDHQKREEIIQECILLIENEVNGKAGLSGLAIKSAYKIFKTIKPNVLHKAVDHLIDDFIHEINPYYERYQKADLGGNFENYLIDNQSRVTESLLSVTDKRAKNSENRTIQAIYQRLRPTANKQVEQAIPKLAALIQKHLPSVG
jgi:hypothetical protein